MCGLKPPTLPNCKYQANYLLLLTFRTKRRNSFLHNDQLFNDGLLFLIPISYFLHNFILGADTGKEVGRR